MKLLSRSEEIILLAVWRLEGNAFGISIRDQVSGATGYEWTLGAIYVPLDKLTRKGLVAKRERMQVIFLQPARGPPGRPEQGPLSPNPWRTRGAPRGPRDPDGPLGRHPRSRLRG